MPVIKIKDSESFEGALKRFKKTCEKAGILTELRRREYYDKPSIRKKKKEAVDAGLMGTRDSDDKDGNKMVYFRVGQ